MNFITKAIRSLPYYRYYLAGNKMLNSPEFIKGTEKTREEKLKRTKRTEIINFLLSLSDGSTSYLEIGVRNPEDNFKHIVADKKYSVDPGIEYEENPVDFKITSDEFFKQLENDEILSSDIIFDVIFIDGLHKAEQVDRDILNSLRFIKPTGFIVLHDCNPPTFWHTRENYYYHHTPAQKSWNGTTWKAYLKWRFDSSINSCCVDTDWGVGILSKEQPIGANIKTVNEFFEFEVLAQNRKTYLNLISFERLKKLLAK